MNKKIKKDLPLVEIDWIDAVSDDNSWQDLTELQEQKLRPVTSVGYLLKEDSKSTIIVSFCWCYCVAIHDEVSFIQDHIVEIQHLEGGRIDEKGIRQQPLQD